MLPQPGGSSSEPSGRRGFLFIAAAAALTIAAIVASVALFGRDGTEHSGTGRGSASGSGAGLDVTAAPSEPTAGGTAPESAASGAYGDTNDPPGEAAVPVEPDPSEEDASGPAAQGGDPTAPTLNTGDTPSAGDTDTPGAGDTTSAPASQSAATEPPAVEVVEPPDPDTSEVPGDTSGSEVAHLAFELYDGGTRTLGHYHGRPLVVNFFSATCPPCIVEMPDFQKAYERLGDEVAFLGLSVDPDPDDSLWVIETTGVTYDLGSDTGSDVFRALDGLGMPTSVFISRDGTVIERFSGRLLEADLLARVDRIRA